MKTKWKFPLAKLCPILSISKYLLIKSTKSRVCHCAGCMASGGISSTFLAYFLALRKSIYKLFVLETVILFFCSSINLSIGLSSNTNLLDFSAILAVWKILLSSWNIRDKTTKSLSTLKLLCEEERQRCRKHDLPWRCFVIGWYASSLTWESLWFVKKKLGTGFS